MYSICRNQSKIELSSQLARIEAAQHEQAHLLRCLLAGDTDKALCLGTVTCKLPSNKCIL